MQLSNGESVRVHSALFGVRFETLLELLDARARAANIKLNWQRYPERHFTPFRIKRANFSLVDLIVEYVYTGSITLELDSAQRVLLIASN